MTEIRTILFLGCSYAGQSAVHYCAKHVLPRLPSDENRNGKKNDSHQKLKKKKKATTKTKTMTRAKKRIVYQIVVVDPSAKFFLRHASPRAIASDELSLHTHLFLNTVQGFQQYEKSVSFVQGRATAWYPDKREVQIRTASGKEESYPYYALVLATGTKTSSPLFSLQGLSHSENQNAIEKTRAQIVAARRIVIGGGGPAGVETAGNLGEMLNGRAAFFSTRPSHPRTQIDLYTSSARLLPVLRPTLAKLAEQLLNRVGVDVHYRTKIVSATASIGGQTEIMLHNGELVRADVYIPATGLVPMTEYVPLHLLDRNGYVVTNEQTMRVDAAGARVYAIGDVAAPTRNNLLDVVETIPVFATNLTRDLLAMHADVHAIPTGPDRLWTPSPAESQLVPIGRSQGVGAVSGWRLPSFLVWLMKGRNYMLSDKSLYNRLIGKHWAREK